MPRRASLGGALGHKGETMIEDATLDYLVARRFGYLLFQRLFGTEPSDELFDAIDEDVATRAFGFVDVEGTTAAYGRELLDLAQAENRDLAARLSDYTRLFVGPAALPAPPWESVYLEGKRMVMQPSTLDIRNVYRAHGFLPALYPRVPDDHLALELDFLASLAAEACDAYDRGDEGRMRDALEASGDFIADHPLKWIDAFACDLEEKGGSDFYACAAKALASFMAADVRRLEAACG